MTLTCDDCVGRLIRLFTDYESNVLWRHWFDDAFMRSKSNDASFIKPHTGLIRNDEVGIITAVRPNPLGNISSGVYVVTSSAQCGWIALGLLTYV